MTLRTHHSPFEIREVPDGIVVDLSSPRRLLTALVVALWLAGWVVGLAFTVQQLGAGEEPATDRAFLLAWAIAWVAAGAYALARLAWLLAGHERVTLAAGRLRIWRGVGRVGLARDYALARIRELRTFGRELTPVLAAGLDVSGHGASGVCFRYGRRVVRFARALDEPSAHVLADRLRAAHPFDGHSTSPAEPAA